jgi:membrane protein implicated in regulation of membrane protease activity
MLSLNSAILFVGGFGIGGFFASTVGCGAVATIASAVVTGIVIALLDALVLGALVRRQSSSATRVADFVGLTGTVEISIAEGGIGRVRCRRGSDTVHLLARAADGAIPVNSSVRVLAIDGGIAVVRPAGELESVPPSWRQ